jgi:hypothetical protein
LGLPVDVGAGHADRQGIQQIEEGGHARTVGALVLEHAQLPAGAQNPVGLAQPLYRIGDGAEHAGGDHHVEAGRFEREIANVGPCEIDLGAEVRGAPFGTLQHLGRSVHRGEVHALSWVMRKGVSRSDPEFEDAAAHIAEKLGAPPPEDEPLHGRLHDVVQGRVAIVDLRDGLL